MRQESNYQHVNQDARDQAGAVTQKVPTIGAEGVTREWYQIVGYYSIVTFLVLLPSTVVSALYWLHYFTFNKKLKDEVKDLFNHVEKYIDMDVSVVHEKLNYLVISESNLQALLQKYWSGEFDSLSNFTTFVDPTWYIIAAVIASIAFSEKIARYFMKWSWDRHVLLTNDIVIHGTKLATTPFALSVDAYYASRNKGFNFNDPDAAVDLYWDYFAKRPNEEVDVEIDHMDFFTKERDNKMHLIKNKEEEGK